mgnify:CR=1 FL=1
MELQSERDRLLESPIQTQEPESLLFDTKEIRCRHQVIDPWDYVIFRLFLKYIYLLGLRAQMTCSLDRDSISWFSTDSLRQCIRLSVPLVMMITFIWLSFGSPGMVYLENPPEWLEQSWSKNLPSCLPSYSIYEGLFASAEKLDNFSNVATTVILPLLFSMFTVFFCYPSMLNYLHTPIFEISIAMMPKWRAVRSIAILLFSSVVVPLISGVFYIIYWVLYRSGSVTTSEYYILPIYVFCLLVFVHVGILSAGSLLLSQFFLYAAMIAYRDKTLKNWRGEPIEEYLVQKHYSIIHVMHEAADCWLYPLTGSIIGSLVVCFWCTVCFTLTGKLLYLAIASGLIGGWIMLFSMFSLISSTNKTIWKKAGDIRGLLAFQGNPALIKQWEQFLLYLSHLNPNWTFWVQISTSLMASIIFTGMSLAAVLAPFFLSFISPCYTPSE